VDAVDHFLRGIRHKFPNAASITPDCLDHNRNASLDARGSERTAVPHRVRPPPVDLQRTCRGLPDLRAPGTDECHRVRTL
jgi:hypothetical protein